MAIIIRELVVRATVDAGPGPGPAQSEAPRGQRIPPREMERIVAAVLAALREQRER